jgi:hypothetical protein
MSARKTEPPWCCHRRSPPDREEQLAAPGDRHDPALHWRAIALRVCHDFTAAEHVTTCGSIAAPA